MPSRLTDPASPVAEGSRRAEVLEYLRTVGRPVGVAEVAAATGLHVNTARFHLDHLVEEGLATRSSEPRETPGRPRIVYTAAGPVPGPRSYALLAEMLTGLVASQDDGKSIARRTGQAWGRHLVERPAPSETLTATQCLQRVNRVLDDVGFRPRFSSYDGEATFQLRHCPFREVALRHPEVVCALHQGLIEGALSELRAPYRLADLQPFVDPSLCVAQLHRSDATPKSSRKVRR
ncbi:MAG: helix-turn-helix domain-containing protein [Acidothermus sp.]|nr:helix-turn-helix domain-containing protein [Acidothermus sp.]MCL6538554.1 helix-turn-helix domain-containing protein [Acidothermus sp.]